jgi:TrmH family RNA methyltransferase
LRIADWFGWDKVFLGPETVELYNPKVIQSSMGAFLRVPVEVIAWERLRQRFPGLNAYGTVIDGGLPADQFVSSAPFCLVIGHESKGMSNELQADMQHLLSIPRGADNSGAESLNAAVAAGILCAFLSSSTKSKA